MDAPQTKQKAEEFARTRRNPRQNWSLQNQHQQTKRYTHNYPSQNQTPVSTPSIPSLMQVITRPPPNPASSKEQVKSVLNNQPIQYGNATPTAATHQTSISSTISTPAPAQGQGNLYTTRYNDSGMGPQNIFEPPMQYGKALRADDPPHQASNSITPQIPSPQGSSYPQPPPVVNPGVYESRYPCPPQQTNNTEAPQFQPSQQGSSYPQPPPAVNPGVYESRYPCPPQQTNNTEAPQFQLKTGNLNQQNMDQTHKPFLYLMKHTIQNQQPTTYPTQWIPPTLNQQMQQAQMIPAM